MLTFDQGDPTLGYIETLAGELFLESPEEIRRLTGVYDHLARNGVVDVGQLYEAPFTGLASGGPEDLFPEADVDAIVAVLRDVRSTAIPVAEAG